MLIDGGVRSVSFTIAIGEEVTIARQFRSNTWYAHVLIPGMIQRADALIPRGFGVFADDPTAVPMRKVRQGWFGSGLEGPEKAQTGLGQSAGRPVVLD